MRHPNRHFHGPSDRSGHPAPGTRGRRRRVAVGIVAAKVAIIAVVLVLPSGLAIGLGAAHGVALLVAAAVAMSLMVVKRHGDRRPARTPAPRHEEGGR